MTNPHIELERDIYKRALEAIAEMRTETLVSQDMAEDWYREVACSRRIIAADALEAGNAINDTANAAMATTY